MLFQYLKGPVWDAQTPAEHSVHVVGVDCDPQAILFRADEGLGQLRMTLSYTPLRPKNGFAFMEREGVTYDAPTVLRNSDRLPAQSFTSALANESGHHTLVLPNVELSHRTAKDGSPLDLLNNELQPSNLNFSTSSACDGVPDSVCGTLEWRVSRGWEGFAYELCATARHAVFPSTLTTSFLFATRCVLIVVPKCHKCFRSGDDLHTLARRYGSTWLDLWSVNPTMIDTTDVVSPPYVQDASPNLFVLMSLSVHQFFWVSVFLGL